MHESVKSTSRSEVRPQVRRLRGLRSLVAALALWGCGEASPPPAEAPAPAPEATASTQAGLTCTPEELVDGMTCAGPFTYSLECYGLRAAPVCGTDTGPKTCTTYNTCEHADFGQRRGTYTLVTGLGKFDPPQDCGPRAEAHLSLLSAADRQGVTYTWYLGQTPPGGESFKAARSGADEASVGDESCYITYSNYPVGYMSGTGPQCGTSQSQCSPACVNPQTCLVNGAWVTGAQCGTLVGPCSATSLSPLYKDCRHPDHGLAPDAQCGAGFENAQAPTGSTPAQTEALAASQWTASKSLGAPVHDAPILCSDCRSPFSLTPVELNRRIYTTAAVYKRDAKLHILAGSAYYLARDNPALTQAELAAGLGAISNALAAYTFDPAQDGSGPLVRLMLRILGRAEPLMVTTTPAGRALRTYAQEFLGSMRGGLDLERALASVHSQVERYTEAEVFIEKSWGQLFDQARGNAALAAAVNGGAIGTTLGVHTTSTAQQILAVYALEPLESFVLSHLTPEGGLTTTQAEARALVTASAVSGIQAAQDYANLLYALNTAEQAYRDSLALPGTVTPAAARAGTAVDTFTTPATTLAEAIEQAKTRRAALSNQLNGVREGVHSGLGMAADLFRKNGELQFADDIIKFSNALNTTLESVARYAESSIKIAEKVSGFLDLGAKGFEIVSAAVFTGQIVGAVFQLFSLLHKGAEPPIEQTLLTELRKLHGLVEQIQDQLATRFDRVDRRLNLIHKEMHERFDQVDWSVGKVSQDVGETQRALYSLQANLNRLDQNMYEYLLDVKRDPFETAVWNYLGWSTRHPIPMDYQQQFIPAEGEFSRWAALDASQSATLAGIDGRGSNPAISPAGELAGHSLSYNINYLREFPLQLGRPALYPQRLSSPMDWMAGAESYAQLFEEQPAHGAAMLSTRHATIATKGAQLDTALRNIDKDLFARLHTRYVADWNGMKALLEGAEFNWKWDLGRKLHGINIWGAPEQEPARHYLKLDAPPPGQGVVLRPMVRCRSNAADWYDLDNDGAAESMETDPARWSHEVLRPLFIADNLDVDSGRLDICVLGEWVWYNAEPTGFQDFVRWTFRLKASVSVRYWYWEAGTWKVQTVYFHSRQSRKLETQITIRQSQVPTFDPNAHFEADKSVQRHWQAMLNPDASDSTWTSGPWSDAFRAAMRQKVVERLRQEQRDFYDAVADRMEQAGDALQQQSERLTGTKLVWRAYVALGLPLSLEHDEELRALLYGEDALLSGHDVLTEHDVEVTPVMDDLVDVYRLFSGAAVPPAHHILADLDPAVRTRADRLKAILDATVDRQPAAGGPEASSWVDATLLRLRLSAPQPH